MAQDSSDDQRPSEALPRLLVFGAGGLLGTELCRLALPQWTVFGIYRRHPPAVPGIQPEYLDITDFRALKQCFSQIRPHAVIHAAAESSLHACQTTPDETARTNILAASNIAGLCADSGIPCVFTSSDMVFDGLSAPYAEDASPSPVCTYGEQKAMAEKGMHARYPNTTICRLPLLIGHVSGMERFFAWMVRRIRLGLPVSLFVDEFRSPVDTSSASTGLLKSIHMPGQILHLGGHDRISRYDIGRWVERILDIKHTCINPVLLMDAEMTAPRPPDITLVSERAFAAGYSPLNIGDALEIQVNAVIGDSDPKKMPSPPL